MLRTSGDVLYVGKAISLKRRVNSYFQKQRGVSERLLEMLSQARDLDVTVTDSAIEAAILESDEIKRHAPPYNVALREEQRDAWFVRRDLHDASNRPDEQHCIGPLPSRRSLASLVALGRLIGVDARSVSPSEARAALGIPVGHRLHPDNVALGFEWFTRTHRQRLLPNVEPARALLSLGAGLWRGRGELPREVDDEKDDDAPWPPGRLTSELERMVMVAVQLIRRARWLCLLSEASVVWKASRVAGDGWRQLVLERGAVVERGYLDQPEPALPPGHGRPPHERRASFDVTVYDRLRTLSTELKRVLVEPDGAVAVRVGERAVVSGERLGRLLRSV
jgi:DNA polymerase-3 subunit epsilon